MMIWWCSWYVNSIAVQNYCTVTVTLELKPVMLESWTDAIVGTHLPPERNITPSFRSCFRSCKILLHTLYYDTQGEGPNWKRFLLTCCCSFVHEFASLNEWEWGATNKNVFSTKKTWWKGLHVCWKGICIKIICAQYTHTCTLEKRVRKWWW